MRNLRGLSAMQFHNMKIANSPNMFIRAQILIKSEKFYWSLVAIGVSFFPQISFAKDMLDRGDTAWLLVYTAFVLMMCIPRAGAVHGGLVRSVNVLSIMTQCYACTNRRNWFGRSDIGIKTLEIRQSRMPGFSPGDSPVPL